MQKRLKKALSVLLAVALLAGCLPGIPAFAVGGGTSLQQSANNKSGELTMDGDVYLIYDAEDLAAFRDLVNGTNDKAAQPSANAKLMNDIDLGGAEKGSWTPIGYSLGSAYTGTFDGQNHTISGLYINTTGGYKGLFGFIGAVLDEENRQGSVQNLFVDGSVNSTGYVGGVAGENSGTVSNCHNIGEIKGTSVGGVVGHNFGGIVENCSNSGAISPNGSNSNLAGGVIGENDPKTSTSVPAEVRNCYSTGNVSGNLVGGVVGENKSGCIVENCYNTGGVTCTSQGGDTGGIVGRNNGNVTHCYNTGTLIGGKQSYVGGVAGDSGGSVQDCCFLNTTGGPQYGIGYDSNSVSGSDAGAAPVDTLAELCGKFAGVKAGKSTASWAALFWRITLRSAPPSILTRSPAPTTSKLSATASTTDKPPSALC